ncbi:hypothetical protein Mlute_02694 [Meiothermus luteus]|jgi:putative membrane protein|uniref:SHOCT domain-containing protein n=1 Tax=Meiothermus luteus TaxID=2026184 RepID=A0A399EFH8_9DEIN|nr:SHOCT domain-containing protein [Meiothermus luteus]RIH81790.1 hypothetical protein Mlute_02694 [Meiothermus luteus]RMH54070.1 MAG: SHOCT domain-containing protein [Deinococcota bacterium]
MLVGHRGHWDGFGYPGLGWADDLLWLLLLLALLVLVGVLILRLLRSSPSKAPDRALEIVRERYARGEISQAEYETLKKNLGG